jgi:hypothetical protein
MSAGPSGTKYDNVSDVEGDRDILTSEHTDQHAEAWQENPARAELNALAVRRSDRIELRRGVETSDLPPVWPLKGA